VPPDVAEENTMLLPTHILKELLVMGAGNGYTVTTTVCTVGNNT
jgi:hypothetical protein